MPGVGSAGGDHAMTTDTTFQAEPGAETELFLGADWFDPLEAGVRTRIRSFIEELLEAELEAALSRKRYALAPVLRRALLCVAETLQRADQRASVVRTG